jgi:hypothetical protein
MPPLASPPPPASPEVLLPVAELLDDTDEVEAVDAVLEGDEEELALGSVDVDPALDPALCVEEVVDAVSPPLSLLELQPATMNASEMTVGAKRECIETSSRLGLSARNSRGR